MPRALPASVCGHKTNNYVGQTWHQGSFDAGYRPLSGSCDHGNMNPRVPWVSRVCWSLSTPTLPNRYWNCKTASLWPSGWSENTFQPTPVTAVLWPIYQNTLQPTLVTPVLWPIYKKKIAQNGRCPNNQNYWHNPIKAACTHIQTNETKKVQISFCPGKQNNKHNTCNVRVNVILNCVRVTTDIVQEA